MLPCATPPRRWLIRWAIRGAIVYGLAVSIGCGGTAPPAPTEVGFVSIFFSSNISAATLLMGPGDRGQALALAAANATARSEDVTAAARWESSNPGVASITAAGGAITAISPGDADIRVFYRGATAQKRVTVFPPESVRQVQISGQNQCWPGQGDLPWEVRATLDTGVIVTANSANWRVADSRVAAISQSGTLTCGAVGSTVVEATYVGRTATRSVTVMVPRDTIEEIGGSSSSTRVGQPTTQGAWGYYVLASAPSGRVIHVIVNQAGIEIASNASSLAVTTGNGPVRLTTTFIIPAGTTLICTALGLQAGGSSQLLRTELRCSGVEP
jgi:Big-like domain-containing protein